jgi:hypothetical protein
MQKDRTFSVSLLVSDTKAIKAGGRERGARRYSLLAASGPRMNLLAFKRFTFCICA